MQVSNMDAVFEIEEEGFEDGEEVTIGTKQPPGTLMSFTGRDRTIHIVNIDSEEKDPTEVLMDLVENGIDLDYLSDEGLEIVVEN